MATSTGEAALAAGITPGGSEPKPLDQFRAELDGLAAGKGLLIGQYRILHFVDGGADGLVYEAEDVLERTRVALKAVLLDPAAPSEVNIARQFTHPSVCRLYQSFRYGAIRVVVMELAEGDSLAHRLGKGDFSPKERLAIFQSIADGVRAMHEGRVLHLDLKPENILLRRDGRPIVADFGLAVRIPDGETAARPLGGTDPYWSPEQRRAHRDHSGELVDERADIHALGMILIRDLFLPPRGAIGRIARKATAKRAERRFRSVQAMLDALDTNKRRRRRLRILALIAGSVVTVVAALRWGLSDWARGRLVERSMNATLHHESATSGTSDLGSLRSSELYCAWFQPFPNGSVFLVTVPPFRSSGRFSGRVFVFTRAPSPRWTMLGDDDGEPLYVVNDTGLLAAEWRKANAHMADVAEQVGLQPLGSLGTRPEDREPHSPELEELFLVPGRVANPHAKLEGGILRLATHFALTNFIGWPAQRPCRTEIVVREYDKGLALGGAPSENCDDSSYLYSLVRKGLGNRGDWNGTTPSPLPGSALVSNELARALDGGGLCRRK